MGECGAHGARVEVEEKYDGTRGDDKMYERRGEIDQMLHGMHGHAGPGADVDVPVVDSVDSFVERRPVEQSMDEIEVG